MNSVYLTKILALCTTEQKELFGRMYPDGPSKKQLPRATEQVEATLRNLNNTQQQLRNITSEYEEFKKQSHVVEHELKSEIYNLKKSLKSAQSTIKLLAAESAGEDITQRLEKLDALEAAGVDNWEWYDTAMENI